MQPPLQKIIVIGFQDLWHFNNQTQLTITDLDGFATTKVRDHTTGKLRIMSC
jgi:hypothetical protein